MKRRVWKGVWIVLGAAVLLTLTLAAWPKPDPLQDFAPISGRKPSAHIPPGPEDWATETWVFAFNESSSELAPRFFEGAAEMGFSREEIKEAAFDMSQYGTALMTSRFLGVLQWEIALQRGDEVHWYEDRFPDIADASAYIVVYKPRPDSWLAHLFSR